jgi:glucokinase
VFDLGGTWFRSAVWAEGGLRHGQKLPAISRERQPGASLEELQAGLVGYVVRTAREASKRAGISDVGISLGAAIDANTGLVVGSAPLWGPTERLGWDIRSALREAAPEHSWTVLNDVSATAVGLASMPQHCAVRRLAVLTVSSGIALRTIEPGTGCITPSAHSGLQGEVGHLPASFTYGGRAVSRLCACGARDHLSAFSSGQGIAGILRELRDAGASWLAGTAPATTQFASAISAGDTQATELLGAITRPLAHTLLAALSIDGAIDRVVVTGGVVAGLGPAVLSSLLDNMAAIGLYGSDCRAASDFARLVHPETDGSTLALRGAALSAEVTRANRHTSDLGRARRERPHGCANRPSERRWHVRAEQAPSYDILLSEDALQPSNPALAELAGILHRPLPQLVVADSAAWRHHGEAITRYFLAYGQEARRTFARCLTYSTNAWPARNPAAGPRSSRSAAGSCSTSWDWQRTCFVAASRMCVSRPPCSR